MSDLNVLEREHEEKILMYLLVLYYVCDLKASEINEEIEYQISKLHQE